jgi:hypothetical protein
MKIKAPLFAKGSQGSLAVSHVKIVADFRKFFLGEEGIVVVS